MGYMPRRNIKLPEDTFQKHNKRRQDLGLTWPEYIEREAVVTREPVEEDRLRTIIREEVRGVLNGYK